MTFPAGDRVKVVNYDEHNDGIEPLIDGELGTVVPGCAGPFVAVVLDNTPEPGSGEGTHWLFFPDELEKA